MTHNIRKLDYVGNRGQNDGKEGEEKQEKKRGRVGRGRRREEEDEEDKDASNGYRVRHQDTQTSRHSKKQTDNQTDTKKEIMRVR